MESLLQDLRHGLRMFRENPAFAAVAVLVLGVGIGVNTAVFSILNRVLLAPIQVPEPDQLVFIMNKANDGTPIAFASPLNFRHWRAETDVYFEDVAAWRNLSLDYLVGDTLVSVPEDSGALPARAAESRANARSARRRGRCRRRLGGAGRG